MRPVLFALPLLLAACASTTETYPGRTATEQLLVARAADDAVDGLTLPVPKTSRIFVDDSYFRAEAAPYAVSAIRESLSKGGHALARTREEADVIFEIRAGALSLEQMRRVFGVPEMRIPINDSFNVVSLPELSVYSRRDRVGVAEFSGFLYDARTGVPLGVVDPLTGQFRIRSHKLFMIFSWGQQRLDPGERDPGDSWREF
ncbi:MAG: hypothetical protein KJ676_03840 [Alphaproteobacteria bacterium]|nr:hypothetical protein [Alphaproteobacteria bacterium]MBU1526437.1 hypothetical protein [Alphaproteobacteria bacterium]MBU2116981.1 hypothetical protein [Alphaproteobacteria bacterium]MBU2352242.1 hypothetical protein [Alphaproteobacteria bacterium]MBU2381705.1 hypothetical protein [Alphaproteobacteria bacterium]